MTYLKKILIPTDFSEFSLGVLRLLDVLVIPRDAKILLLHVLSENVLVEPVLDLYAAEQTAAGARIAEAEHYLRAVAEERLAGYTRVECVVRRGEPAAEIVKLAEHDHAGMVLMATHGRTGIAHIFMGSVAEKVVRTSRVPVLTARPTELLDPGAASISARDVREQLHLR